MVMGRILVRSAKATDEAAIARLWRSCGLVTTYNDPGEDFRMALHKPASDVLVGELRDGGQRVLAQSATTSDDVSNYTLVGSVMVGHDGHRGWLYYVASDPMQRGKGIGKQMVQAAEDWLRDKGVRKAALLIRHTNKDVARFYDHLGYEEAHVTTMAKWL